MRPDLKSFILSAGRHQNPYLRQSCVTYDAESESTLILDHSCHVSREHGFKNTNDFITDWDISHIKTNIPMKLSVGELPA